MIEARQRVIVYGDSLLLAGVRVTLGAHPDIEVISVTTSGEDLAEELRALQPAAVVFDLGGIHPMVPATLLTSSLLLIGIDPEKSQALVWSGHQESAVATADLVNLICTLGCVGESQRRQPDVVG